MSFKPPYGTPIVDSLVSGLISCWVMNKGSGTTAFDIASDENDGAFSPTPPTWDALGIEFNGSSNFLTLSTISEIAIGSAFTVAGRFNSDVTDGFDNIFSQTNGAGDRLAIGFGDDDTLRGGLYDGSWNGLKSGAVAEGVVHDFAYSWDGSSEGWLTIDGVTQVGTSNPGTSGNVATYIGRRTDTDKYFDGVLHHIYLYNRVLTSPERSLLHNNPYYMFYSPTTGTWVVDLNA